MGNLLQRGTLRRRRHDGGGERGCGALWCDDDDDACDAYRLGRWKGRCNRDLEENLRGKSGRSCHYCPLGIGGSRDSSWP